jgi:unsaturated rhamnogalacturonyl hydrolase
MRGSQEPGYTAPMKAVVVFVLALGSVVAGIQSGMDPADPLRIARVLAGRYPAQPAMSYIPALAWSGQLRLSELTGEPQWRDKAMKDLAAFTGGQTRVVAEPYRLTSLAGALAFHDAWVLARDPAAQKLAMELTPLIVEPDGSGIRFATGWTDDMFMVSAPVSRIGIALHAEVVHQLLVGYAKRLQRADGLFIHAANGPHAWGRGNGFALLGVTDALTYWPESWSGRAAALEIYRRHVAALAKHQSDDGSWRQVVDEPSSYRELTVTAMVTAALARGISRGWIDAATYEATARRGWQAVAARVGADGAVRDVCSSTGAGESKEYYLNRPVVNGFDDRGGAMALTAALEIAGLQRTR